MLSTYMGITGPQANAAQVRALVQGLGWQVKEDRTLALQQSLGKMQMLTELLTTGQFMVRPRVTGRIFAARIIDNMVWFSVTACPSNMQEYACGFVDKDLFRKKCECATSTGILSNIDRHFIKPHLDKKLARNDGQVVLLDEKGAKDWVNLTW